MLTWPHADSDWAETLELVEPVFLELATEIARREQLLVNCAEKSVIDRIQRQLCARGITRSRLSFALTPSDDTWARDHGPLTVLDDNYPRLLDFNFNGWGNKYPADRDNAINRRLATAGCFGDCPMDSLELVLEGGSIDSDGEGTLLTTSSCQLHPRRNPGLSKQDVEDEFAALFGAERVLWLDHGCLEGDDTDGHIDMLVRFSDPRTLVFQDCDETGYPCYDALQDMRRQLQTFGDRQGRPYRLIALPWPQPLLDDQGRRLPASYANFLVINNAVLLPSYRDPADVEAARLLQTCFPGREIVPVNCRPMIQQYGSLHCATMQFPAELKLFAGT
jgi:agmatine/peptidylarginine deiminase